MHFNSEWTKTISVKMSMISHDFYYYFKITLLKLQNREPLQTLNRYIKTVSHKIEDPKGGSAESVISDNSKSDRKRT